MKLLALGALAAIFAYHWRRELTCLTVGHQAPERRVSLGASFCPRCSEPAEAYLDAAYAVDPDGAGYLTRSVYDRVSGKSKRIAV